ncbi:MAG TPA: glycosyltransferase family 39 protein [Acetobacteraceae bacterium]|nr:glycosyltransferase family 39 protein [Acetobacteraceae bacterium]
MTGASPPCAWPLPSIIAALIALTLLRLAIAAAVPLAPDEAYYWVWSHALAPGYPDHPPMIALWIRLGTSIAGDGPLGIRLLGPISVALASVLLANATDALFPGNRSGVRAAVLLNATLLFGVGAIIMTPDAPLLVFWTACLWAIARLQQSGDARWWLAIGLFAGLALASKYTAALLWLGIVLWVLITPSLRHWLRHPMPWLGTIVAVAIFAPVVFWNAGHDWTSFGRQGGRLGDWHPGNAVRFMTELIAGQFGLLTPLAFAFCVGGIVLAARNAWRSRDPAWTLLAVLTIPGAILFLQHALGDRVQGNWPAIIYPAAAIAATQLRTDVWRRLWSPAIALGFAITLLAYVQALFAVLPLPLRLDPIALILSGWDRLAAQVDAIRQETGAQYIAADQYGVAAELAYALKAPVVGLEPRWAMFDLPRAPIAGQVGVLVQTGGDLDRTLWSSVTELAVAKRGIQTFGIYRVTTSASPVDARLLVRN